jgi:hypothetical protein
VDITIETVIATAIVIVIEAVVAVTDTATIIPVETEIVADPTTIMGEVVEEVIGMTTMDEIDTVAAVEEEEVVMIVIQVIEEEEVITTVAAVVDMEVAVEITIAETETMDPEEVVNEVVVANVTDHPPLPITKIDHQVTPTAATIVPPTTPTRFNPMLDIAHPSLL